jgi:hypothetical protein
MQVTNFKKHFSFPVVFTCIAMLYVAFAQTAFVVEANGHLNNNNQGTVNLDNQPSVNLDNPPQTYSGPCKGGGSDTTLCNPLKSESLIGFLLDVLDIFITFAIPIIILMIIWSGFKYVLARGNEEQVKGATRSLTYVVVGGLLILGAKLILEVVQGTVNQLLN